ncbi:MAG: hypothetical protein LBT02_03340 [Rickettsiales bacterium]|jgi:ferredoxin-like protein FixX|nr:hypothetical protein [Rickettsiales bacterium]
MTRVVVTKNYTDDLNDADKSCPAVAFKKGPNGEVVIDPNACIDCGVCQSIAKEGAILDESEAKDEDKKFNADNASKW